MTSNIFIPVNGKITPTAYVIRLILWLDSRRAYRTNAVPFYEKPLRGSEKRNGAKAIIGGPKEDDSWQNWPPVSAMLSFNWNE
jgi:hypothetical protein